MFRHSKNQVLPMLPHVAAKNRLRQQLKPLSGLSYNQNVADVAAIFYK